MDAEARNGMVKLIAAGALAGILLSLLAMLASVSREPVAAHRLVLWTTGAFLLFVPNFLGTMGVSRMGVNDPKTALLGTGLGAAAAAVLGNIGSNWILTYFFGLYRTPAGRMTDQFVYLVAAGLGYAYFIFKMRRTG